MKRKSQLQIRISDEDKLMAEQLASEYALSLSELVRYSLIYINRKRPSLLMEIVPQSKQADVPSK